MAGDFKQMAEIDVRGAIVGIQLDSLLNLDHRLIDLPASARALPRLLCVCELSLFIDRALL